MALNELMLLKMMIDAFLSLNDDNNDKKKSICFTSFPLGSNLVG